MTTSPYRNMGIILFVLFLLLFTLPNIAFLWVPRQFWAQPAVVTVGPIVPIIAFFGLVLIGMHVLKLPTLPIIEAVAGAGLSSIIISVLVLGATGQITSGNVVKLVGFLPPILFFTAMYFALRKARKAQE